MSNGNAYVGPHPIFFGSDAYEKQKQWGQRQQQENEEKRQQEKRRKQADVAFSLYDPKFIAPVEGLSFGEQCTLQVGCSANGQTNISPSVRFVLSVKHNNRSSSVGEYPASIQNNVAKADVKLQQPQGWKSGDKTVFTFKARLHDGTVAESPEYGMPSKGLLQQFRFQMVDDSCGCSGRTISIKGRTGKEVCKAFVPSYATQNVESVTVRDNQLKDFYYPKPGKDTPFELIVQSGHEKGIPLTLPDVFFEDNEPIYVLHSALDGGSFGSAYGGGFGGAGFSNSSEQAQLKPVDLCEDMVEEEPFLVVELKGSASAAGLKEGLNLVDGVSELAKKIIYETVYGNTIFPATVQTSENWKLISDFFDGGRFYIKNIKGRDYIVFKGFAGLRRWYTGPKYLLKNSRVVSLSATRTAGSAAKGAFRLTRGVAISIIFVGAMDINEWANLPDAERTWENLIGTLASDAIQMALSGLAGSLAMWAIAAAAGAAAPVALVIIGGIAVSFATGLALTWLDDRLDLTEKLQKGTSLASQAIKDTYRDNVVNPLVRMLYRFEQEIIFHATGGRLLYR